MGTSSKFNAMSALIRLGDLPGMQAYAAVDFDWTQVGGDENITLLHFAIDCGKKSSTRANNLPVIEWMLKAGADPEQELPSHHPGCSHLCKRWDKKGTMIKVRYACQSPISLAAAWVEALRKVDWGAATMKHFSLVLSVIATAASAKRHKVAVHQAVMDRWESAREMTSTHNVTFETADGAITAHDHILMAASPVLQAMLQSTMKEGQQKQISVADSSGTGVSLLLDMLYTSSTRTDPDFKTMLVALDLAHRWQVQDVVKLLSEALRDMITTDSFSAIAETAALKGLDALARCCATFGTKTAEVQAMLKNGSLPVSVQRLLQGPEAPSQQGAVAKKRRTF